MKVVHLWQVKVFVFLAMKRVDIQTKTEHLKEKKALERKTRSDKKRKKHVSVVTHCTFAVNMLRNFYFDIYDKPNDDLEFRAAHNLATCHWRRKKTKGP